MQETEERGSSREISLVQRVVAVMGAPLFDNAAIVIVPQGAPKMVQFIYPYYENPEFFGRQLQLWSSYDNELLDRLRVIVVDDGSPGVPASSAIRSDLPFDLRLFRIEVDVRWNWLAARNIGMQYAREGWCVLTDMDHMVSAQTLRRIIFGQHDEQVIYRFSRRENTGEMIHPHPNSMLMTKAMFWRIGGYDEVLSGFYGTDGDWRRRCASAAKIRTLSDELERHERVVDSSTTKYLRKQPQDAGKKALIQARVKIKNWRPRTLSFPYHEVDLNA